MTALSQSAFLHALAWSLLNSLWQFAALWLVFIAITYFFKNITAAFKYNAALLLLAAGTALAFINFCVKYFYTPFSSFAFIHEATPAYQYLYTGTMAGIYKLLPYLSILYLGIITVLFLRFVYFVYASYLLQATGLVKASPVWKLYVNEMAMYMSIKKNISVWLSQNVDAPVLIGYFKPVILLPFAAINQLSTEQLEAILLHEIAHIKRNDYFTNLLVNIAGILLFFNPFAKLLIGVIEKERENSCDDWVLQFRYSPEKYASALLTLEKNRLASLPALSLSSNGKNNKQLLHRIKRIMCVPVKEPKQKKYFAFPLVFIFSVAALFIQPVNTVNIASTPTLQYDAIMQPGGYNSFVNVNKLQQPLAQSEAYEVKYEIKTQSTAITKTCGLTKTKDNKCKNEKVIASEEKPVFSNRCYAINASADNEVNAMVCENMTAVEKKDYVIPTAPSSVVLRLQATAPYIPESSFSYYEIQDSTGKFNANEHALKLALLKANVALELAQKKNIAPDNKLLKNLNQALARINYFDQQNIAAIIDMQAASLVQMIISIDSKNIQAHINTWDHIRQIDSLQKAIRIVKKGAVITL